jgi:excisionase family DNA binding protein
MDDDDTVSVDEAAYVLALVPETVRRRIRAGRLPAVRTPRGYRIAVPDVMAAQPETDVEPLPDEWRKTFTGGPQLNWVRIQRLHRIRH